MRKRPNILFLMSDEHRPDITGYEGNTVVRTPVLDELARTGVVFRNAYAPSPICVPGRQSMMTGCFPKTCGCERYGEDLPPFSMTFSRRFSQYGYQTVCAGKLHHMGIDQMQGWTTRIGMDMNVSRQYIEGLSSEKTYTNPMKFKWSDAKEIRRAGIGRGRAGDRDYNALDGVLSFIRNFFLDPYWDRATPDNPLFLKVSFTRPHYPYLTTEEKFSYYLNRVPIFAEHEAFDHPFLSQRQVKPGTDVSEREIRRATAAYYGMIEEIDEDFGRVCDALRSADQDIDEWIVIYTSDHGEMLGEHGIWEKQKFFESSVRVPLIIRWPKGFKEHKVIDKNVNLCDLFRTLCELCDIPVPDGLDSRSLVPFLDQGVCKDWNNETVSQFEAKNLMIKQDHLKYQYYGPDIPEVLFNLEVNPEETINYINDPGYENIVQDFRTRCAELGFSPDADPGYKNAGY